MSTTPNMGMILPDDHDATEADVWGALLVTALGINDAHDHSPGKGVLIPMTGIKANADKSWSFGGSSFAITDLKAVDFAPVASSAVTGFAGALFVSDGSGGLAANELYWRTTSGSNVRLTSGAALNVATFVGGIGGDYSAVGALLDYDDATDTYRFRQETAASVRQFGKVQFADIKLMEHDPAGDATVPSFGVTIRSPDALAANYTVTWPGALPAADNDVSVAASGQLAFGHGDRVLTFSGTDFIVQSGTASYNVIGDIASSAACVLVSTIKLKVGDRIKSITIVFDSGTGTVDVTTFEVNKIATNGTSTSLGSTSVNNIGAPTPTTINLTDTTLAAGESFIVILAINAAGCSVRNGAVTYDRPP